MRHVAAPSAMRDAHACAPMPMWTGQRDSVRRTDQVRADAARDARHRAPSYVP
ncbi:hypothetical protein [Streptomyces sp. NPDC018833]|uniref:hypothetical protein n=1 Tax=Streptomyces sp. NPDC018833 TaxID=3365053 RepID=UPI00379332EE